MTMRKSDKLSPEERYLSLAFSADQIQEHKHLTQENGLRFHQQFDQRDENDFHEQLHMKLPKKSKNTEKNQLLYYDHKEEKLYKIISSQEIVNKKKSYLNCHGKLITSNVKFSDGSTKLVIDNKQQNQETTLIKFGLDELFNRKKSRFIWVTTEKENELINIVGSLNDKDQEHHQNDGEVQHTDHSKRKLQEWLSKNEPVVYYPLDATNKSGYDKDEPLLYFGNNNLYKVDHEKGRATLIAEGVQEINRSFVWNDVALLKNLPKECGENQAVRVDEKCLESIRKVVDIVKRKQVLENKPENNLTQGSLAAKATKARNAQTSPSMTLTSENYTNIDR